MIGRERGRHIEASVAVDVAELEIRPGAAFGQAQGGPILAINPLSTDTERSEQRGFVNLLVGLFGTFRNPTAHAPRIYWPISEQDSLDILSLVSLVHRKLDKATRVLPATP